MKYFSEQHKYNTLNNYLRAKFGTKVFKIALNAGFTCPNRDGLVAYGGCTFCSDSGSGDFAGSPTEPIKVQFEKQRQMMHNKWKDAKYIVYFQANSNTYANLDVLKKLFEEAINLDPNIVAISIGTRCDCLSDQIIDYLAELSKRVVVWVELGLQTIHSKSMEDLNLGYNLETFNDAVARLRKSNIEVVIHIINGLPNETKEMMLATLNHLNTLDIQGLKIHSLFLLKGTKLGNSYLANPFKILSLEEYVEITATQIAHLNANIIIHRISGDAPSKDLIEPLWSRKKFVVMNEIDKYLKAYNLYQGKIKVQEA